MSIIVIHPNEKRKENVIQVDLKFELVSKTKININTFEMNQLRFFIFWFLFGGGGGQVPNTDRFEECTHATP